MILLLHQIAIVVAAIGIILVDIAYYLTLPSCNRKKLLKGYSLEIQMRHRQHKSHICLQIGLALLAALILVYIICMAFVPIDTTISVPKTVHSIHKQHKSVFIIDGKVWIKDWTDWREGDKVLPTPLDSEIRHKISVSKFGFELTNKYIIEWSDRNPNSEVNKSLFPIINNP